MALKKGAQAKEPALQVWLDDPDFGALQVIGTLHKVGPTQVRFRYDPAWLANPMAFKLDPELNLDNSNFFPQNSNFGIFMDSCPDRWGQVLMQRREAADAKDEGRAKRILGAWDFLCGVQDATRMGALRFAPAEGGEYLASELRSAPPITKIAELQEIALELSRKTIKDVDKLRDWLKVLVAPGASLGGARPKANILDGGELWIAKFPAADDDRDVAVWEKLLHDMARDCGIDVPTAKILSIRGDYHTFMVKRFDRDGERRRFFTSAMTALNKSDKEPASYPELAEFLADHGSPAHIKQDLKELFRRVLFNVCTANRDDHLRNHGFMRIPEGWRLAKAYDMNPNPFKEEHELGLDAHLHAPDLSTVLDTAAYYRLDAEGAQTILDEVLAVVATWKTRAKALGIARADIEDMEHLFITDA
jgi:serine/threonine-protein kinase HipA